jgi:purine-binding chemotaxis protein CheW
VSSDAYPQSTTTVASRSSGGKFLTFFLAGEEYGLEILKVHEIIGMLPVTRVPRTPDYIRGVINLRGKVIPIVDLRQKFGMPQQAVAQETCIIVVQVLGVSIGVVVDKVSEVASIAASEIEPPPSFGADVPTDFLLGLGKSNGRIRLLLDIDRVLSTTELHRIDAVRTHVGPTDA